MKVRIITNSIYEGGTPAFAQVTSMLKRTYCKRHGYEFLDLHENPHPELNPCWSKPGVILQH